MIRAITFIQLPNSNVFEVTMHDYTKEEQASKFPSIFFSYEEARDYLSKQRRSWLIENYTNYVKHKSKLFRVSASAYYLDFSRLDNLTRLEGSLELIPTMMALDLCNVIVKAKQLLLSILPHPSNSSHQSADALINQIFAVALDEINDVHGLFKSKN